MSLPKSSFPLAAAAVVAVSTAANAVVFEDFQFNDPNGTELGSAVNTANPGNLWMNNGTDINNDPIGIPGDVSGSTVQDGSFSIMKADDLYYTRHLQIDNVTSGVQYLVVDIAGWNIVADNGAELEDVGWAFLDNDTGFSGSTIAAQTRLFVFAPTVLRLEGTALGTGASNVGTADFGMSRSDPLSLAIKLDKDNDEYEVMYKDNTADWASLGSGNLGLKLDDSDIRDGNSVRWRINNNFGALGEYFDVDRIYLTDTDPTLDTPALDGDLNSDGFVGVDDLNIVLVNWNQNVTPGDLASGDPTGEGFVGVDDLNIVLVNWNNGTPPSGAAAVPEPMTLTLLGLGGTAMLLRRR